jgi:hypothetical protein
LGISGEIFQQKKNQEKKRCFAWMIAKKKKKANAAPEWGSFVIV